MNKKEIVGNWALNTFGLLVLGPFAAIPVALVFLAIFYAAVGLGFTTSDWGSHDSNGIMALIYAAGVGSLGGAFVAAAERKKPAGEAALRERPNLQELIRHLKDDIKELESILEDERTGRALLVNQLESDLFREGSPDLTYVIESSEFAPFGLRSETLDAVGRRSTAIDEFGRMTPEKETDEGESEE